MRFRMRCWLYPRENPIRIGRTDRGPRALSYSWSLQAQAVCRMDNPGHNPNRGFDLIYGEDWSPRDVTGFPIKFTAQFGPGIPFHGEVLPSISAK